MSLLILVKYFFNMQPLFLLCVLYISEPLRGLVKLDQLDYGLSSMSYSLSRARLTDGENNSSNGIKLTLLPAVITPGTSSSSSSALTLDSPIFPN